MCLDTNTLHLLLHQNKNELCITESYRYACMKSLEHTGQIENLMSYKGLPIVWHGRQEGEAPHYCFSCEVSTINYSL